MKRLFILMVAAIVLLQSEASLQAGIVGSLSSHVANGIYSGGEWGLNEDGFQIKWTISQNDDQSWHYKYEFFKASGDQLRKLVSHFDFSLSDNITADDLYDFGSDIGEVTFGTFGPGPSSPGLPTGESISGVKLDFTNNQTVAEFDSTRQPMWGDFYTKGGISYGDWNYAYNIDIGVGVANLHDYTGTAVDAFGNELSKILVPNTIPEPTTISMLGIGALMSFMRRKKLK
ncbi:PEP-CTERM sorting domain-containing protein [Candidatus Pacearchaeota archaeon]|nr:PEP-CTERM sorting domain-containing protein [Candidatus Pacearchaeota archaeon]